MTITFPGGQVAGEIQVVLPAGWQLTGATVNGLLGPSSTTGSDHSWVIVAGSGVTLALEGPSTPAAVLTGTVTTLAGSSPIAIPLP